MSVSTLLVKSQNPVFWPPDLLYLESKRDMPERPFSYDAPCVALLCLDREALSLHLTQIDKGTVGEVLIFRGSKSTYPLYGTRLCKTPVP